MVENGFENHTNKEYPDDCENSQNNDTNDTNNGRTELYSVAATNKSLNDEIKQMMNLAIPTMVIEFASTVPYTFTASYIGRHYSPVELGGYTIAVVTGNVSAFMLLLGIFSASDTLSPQAYGAGNYNELGLIALRGTILGLTVVVSIVLILLFYMTPLLELIGQDTTIATTATSWFRIYAISLPFIVLIQVIWKFLSAQHILTPLVIMSIFGSFIGTPILLPTLEYELGYLGTATALSINTILQLVFLVYYLQWKKPYHPGTWTGLTINNWEKALQWEPFSTFAALSFGGILASSEWFYWEILSLLVGTLGVMDLSIHTIPTQVVFLSFNLGYGIMIAMATQIGHVLPHSVERAKRLCFWGSIGSTILFAIISIVSYIFRESIFRVFTNETEIIAGCESIWYNVIIFMFNTNIFYMNMGIATALGMQWFLGIITAAFLFGFGLPTIYYYAVVRDGNITAVWQWIWPSYVCINLSLGISFVRADWDRISTDIRIREGLDVATTNNNNNNNKESETSSLLIVSGGEVPNNGYNSIN